MSNKKSFFKENPKKIFIVLFVALAFALIVPFIVFLIDHYTASIFGSWKSFGLFAPLGFCGFLSFYDEKYTGLRLLGTMSGAITGILMMLLIPSDEGLFLKVLLSLFMGALCAPLGYLIVGYSELVVNWRVWHW